MSAIPVLLFFSLLLAATFVVLFARDHRRRRFASAERDSLLPLADETPRAVGLASVSTPTSIAAVPRDTLGVLSPSNEESGDHAQTVHPSDHDHNDDHDHDHDHEHAGACGCRDGSRPPCPGCLRRRDASAPVAS